MSDVPNERGFWNALLKRVRRATRGRQDAEDLLHSAYVRLEKYRTENKVEKAPAFLVRTAVNMGVDQHRHERFIIDEPIGSGTFDLGDPERLPDEVLAARERLRRVNE